MIDFLLTLLIGALVGIIASWFAVHPVRRERTALRVSHFGVLTGSALRYQLRHARGRLDIIAVDIRKLHTLNEVFTMAGADELIREWINLVGHRASDIVGQWSGGDEFIFAVAPGDAEGYLQRCIAAAQVITERMTLEQRRRISEDTNGLVDGFYIAASTVEDARYPLAAAESAVNEAGKLKAEGKHTGDRATSGAIGTVWNRQHTF